MSFNPNSRFQVVNTLLLSPGESVITRSTEGPFIDTGVDLNIQGKPMFRGRLYLTRTEVLEMADQLGLFDAYEDHRINLEDAQNEAVAAAHADGYAAGYAERVDATAAELVERMRARVQRDRDDSGDGAAAEDVAGAVDAPVAGAEAPVGEGRDDLPGTEPAGDDSRAA